MSGTKYAMSRRGSKIHVIRDRHPQNSEQTQVSLCGVYFRLPGYYRYDYVKVLPIAPQDMIGMCDTCLAISRRMEERDELASS